MEQPVPSTAGRRQFNDTALAKLVAEGVPRNVAYAFINHGIDKSGRYAQLRDHVCKMEYVRYLLPRTVADYKDPMRVGQLAPYVDEQKIPRFFTEFAMSDVESARFSGFFPEFNVIPRGTTYNQHGYYANKRYAEAELLVGMVFDHARKNGADWDPKSLTDVGGNETWHSKRDRDYVHNDNPVLSARDVARYTTRRVFSGAQGKTTCDKKFSQCTHRSQYGIAVHSTYDFSPRALAFGMCKRGMKVFYLVINVVPGLGSMHAGQYEVDGVVVTLHRPTRDPAFVTYTFKHDASLEYKHPLSVHQAYLSTRATFDVSKPDGTVSSYVYRILSVRGNSLIATMEEVLTPTFVADTFAWTGVTRRVYFITIKWLDVSNLEVDCEFFDRLVYQAAGARGAENYDIVSLYKYAKSLRQRVSINGIVLSSGYTLNPEHLVTAVIASYAVATAFRTESAGFFREASSQIHARRGQGFMRDLLKIVGRSLLAPFGALASVLGAVTFYTKADRKLKAIVARQGAVHVCVDKPHAGAGAEFQPAMLEKPPVVGNHGLVRAAGADTGSWVSPLAPGGWNAKLVPTYVNCGGVDKVFVSYSVTRMDDREVPGSSKPQYYDLTGMKTEVTMKSEEYRSQLYAATLRQIVGAGAFDIVPLILPTGDRLYRKRMRPMDGENTLTKGSRMITESDTYIVFRGVGDCAVSLAPPACYAKGTCLRFVLFYVDEVADKVKGARAGKQVGVDSVDVATLVTSLASGGGGVPVVGPVVAPLELYSSPVLDSSSEWESVPGQPSRKRVVSFAEHLGDEDYVFNRAVKGEFFMTGAVAVGQDTPPLSHTSSDTLVYTARRGSLPKVAEEAEEDLLEGFPGFFRPGHVRSGSDEAAIAVEAEAGLFEAEDASDREVAPVVGGDAPEVVLPVGPVVSEEPVGLGLVELADGESDAGGHVDESVSSSDVHWGRDAMAEQILLCDAARSVALASSAEVVDLAISVARGDAPLSVWGAAMEGKQGSPVPVKVVSGEFKHAITGVPVLHMAVSDGDDVYDKLCNPPPDGLYVTSDVMAVYTGGAIRDTIASVLTEAFQCPVTNMNGVAGSGKTHTITHQAELGDVVLCETTGALRDTARRLEKSGRPWDGAAWTMDSFLMHRPRDRCNNLWVDESLRLHAAKIFAVVKLLKPVNAYCFGDSKQIPLLPFVPGFEFSHSSFPFTSVNTKRDTWRSPADVCFITSHKRFYGYHVRTHNPVLRSVVGPELFRQGIFHNKRDEVVLLTYTQNAKHDLVMSGVKNVMTIGESQGGTFDEVVLYRDSPLGKPLYNDMGQSLVALTRHRKKFTYVTVTVNDTSTVAESIKYLRDKADALLLASHSYAAQRSPVVVRGVGYSRSSVASDDSDVSRSEAETGKSGRGAMHSARSSGSRVDWADDSFSDF